MHMESGSLTTASSEKRTSFTYLLLRWFKTGTVIKFAVFLPNTPIFIFSCGFVLRMSVNPGSWQACSNRRPENMTDMLEKDALSIALQEFYPIVIAAILWSKFWSRKRILFHCDNKATVFALNKGRSFCPDIMTLMRRLVLVAGHFSFTYWAVHIAGKKHSIADSLSRLQIARFRQLAPPGTASEPYPIPTRVIFD